MIRGQQPGHGISKNAHEVETISLQEFWFEVNAQVMGFPKCPGHGISKNVWFYGVPFYASEPNKLPEGLIQCPVRTLF